MLERVTITGADDTTDIIDLIALSEEYPFVEWGILVSRSSEGRTRFPSRAWIDKLIKQIDGDQLSMHICGAWVEELLVGELIWEELPSCYAVAERIQINTHGHRYVSSLGMIAALSELYPKEFIFQWDKVNDHLAYAAQAWDIKVSALYDTSAGAGKLPSTWLPPTKNMKCGYAGGLGADNVTAQLEKIAAVCKQPFWIDMENNVRWSDNSRLDMIAVRSVLEQSKHFVKRGWSGKCSHL